LPRMRLHVVVDRTGGHPSTDRRLVGAINRSAASSLVRQWTGGVAVKIF
jgi:hypothetical protein